MDNCNDYIVSAKRRAVWAAEIKLLEAFKNICEKYQLRYFAVAGTLLGAVRHKGFIPWDDDIDVCMFREDYEFFLKVAKNELPAYIFLQTSDTEEDYFYGHAKLRMNHTTAIRYIQYPEKYTHHQGIFLDIFPYDNIPDNSFLRFIHEFVATKLMMAIYYRMYYYRLNHHSLVTKIKHKTCMCLLPTISSVRRVFRFFEKWVQLANKSKTTFVAEISIYYYLFKKDGYKREWFEKSINVPFENTAINIPVDYDKILTRTFGNYMKPVKAPSDHGDVFFDLNHDYKEYYNGKLCFTKDDTVL